MLILTWWLIMTIHGWISLIQPTQWTRKRQYILPSTLYNVDGEISSARYCIQTAAVGTAAWTPKQWLASDWMHLLFSQESFTQLGHSVLLRLVAPTGPPRISNFNQFCRNQPKCSHLQYVWPNWVMIPASGWQPKICTYRSAMAASIFSPLPLSFKWQLCI